LYFIGQATDFREELGSSALAGGMCHTGPRHAQMHPYASANKLNDFIIIFFPYLKRVIENIVICSSM